MPFKETQELVEEIISIAEEAGKNILQIYETGFTVQTKKDDSPLTRADMESHRVIARGLEKITPGIPVLSEESCDIPWSTRKRWTTYWLVDPLDGTREFVNKNGEFTVNISMIHNHYPVLGVVHAPVSETTYHASRGSGAHRKTAKEPVKAIKVAEFMPDKVWKIVGSRSHMNSATKKLLAQIENHKLVPCGSSLKFCLVAEGKADFYPRLGLTSEWDTAAAQCIVEEAGGHVLNLGFTPLKYNAKKSLLNDFFLVCGKKALTAIRELKFENKY